MKTKVRGLLEPRAAAKGSFALDAASINSIVLHELARIGVNVSERDAQRMIGAMADFGMSFGADEAIPNPSGAILPGTIPTPIQFLQNWLPGFVRVVTQPRNIDTLIGVTSSGDWADEEVVQGVLENIGHAVPYGDYTNIPLASWNPSFERRTIVRLEMGMAVGVLEEARSSKMNVSTSAEKRTSVQLALDIARNRIGFYGYNSGLGRTYGFLNDPSLPAYITVAAGVGGTTWATKTFLEITADIRTAIARLRTQSKGVIDPSKTPLTLALPVAAVDYLSVTGELGYSVRKWLTDTYPNVRIESAPELDLANGGSNVFYLYAERVEDDASDGSNVWAQIVPARYQLLGVEKRAKSYVEASVTATAGALLKRPYAIVRYSGI